MKYVNPQTYQTENYTEVFCRLAGRNSIKIKEQEH